MKASLQPHVSCLCVTRNRPHDLRKAISHFMHQTYANKDLVILYETDDLETAAVAEEARQRGPISATAVPAVPKLTLGELRNIALEACQGDYFCQWDDDDWYSVNRIAAQVSHLQSMHQDACVLTNWFMFDTTSQRAYLSHFRLWEGSILCRKAALGGSVRYPAMSKMEDSFFMNALSARCRVVPLIAPELYVYVLHEQNTWDRYHRQVVLSRSQYLGPDVSRQFSDILQGRHSAEEASALLTDRGLKSELDYLHGNTLTPTDAQLHRYREAMEAVAHADAARRPSEIGSAK